MHHSAMEKMRAFVDGYLCDVHDKPLTILDVGSRTVRNSTSHRAMMSINDWHCTGMDMVEGGNVDVVVDDPYNWSELEDSSYDVVICGQVFEHVQFFWITASEIARVMKAGGLCCIIAPSAGQVHRFPYDCWRFYPDGLPSVATYAGLTVLESYVPRPGLLVSPEADTWRDACVVARKPHRTLDQSRSFELRAHLNQLLLKAGLSTDDLQGITVGTREETISFINVDDNRDVFNRLEAAHIARIGLPRLKLRLVANHLNNAWKAVWRSL